MTKDLESVGNYALTSEQNNKAQELMLKYGYKDMGLFVDAMLRYGNYTLERLRKEGHI